MSDTFINSERKGVKRGKEKEKDRVKLWCKVVWYDRMQKEGQRRNKIQKVVRENQESVDHRVIHVAGGLWKELLPKQVKHVTAILYCKVKYNVAYCSVHNTIWIAAGMFNKHSVCNWIGMDGYIALISTHFYNEVRSIQSFILYQLQFGIRNPLLLELFYIKV